MKLRKTYVRFNTKRLRVPVRYESKAAASELPGLGYPFWSKMEGGDIQKRSIKTQNQVLINLVPVSHTYPGPIISTVRDGGVWRGKRRHRYGTGTVHNGRRHVRHLCAVICGSVLARHPMMIWAVRWTRLCRRSTQQCFLFAPSARAWERRHLLAATVRMAK